ncbi:hypothetical protein I4U23_006522 [Adineta vaga]|nr:hypothetical protein I4U23_006522 [Adineta vaga]
MCQNDHILSSVNIENSSSSSLTLHNSNASLINILHTTNESLDHGDNIDIETSTKSKKSTKTSKTKSSLLTPMNGSTIRINKSSIKRTLSKTNLSDIERKKRSELLPTIVDRKRTVQRSETFVESIDTSRKEKKLSNQKTILKEEQQQQPDDKYDNPLANINPSKICTLN